MLDRARSSGRDLAAMTRMKEMMDGAGFIDITKSANQWPLHSEDKTSDEFAEMVRTNFERGTMDPAEVKLHLAGLHEEASDKGFQTYWQV
jgi:hypothetical protein